MTGIYILLGGIMFVVVLIGVLDTLSRRKPRSTK